MGSISKKAKSILQNGIAPIIEGMDNYANPKPEIEALAKERLKTCRGCEFYADEPIPLFAIKDHTLAGANKKFCDNCGCALPYKLRQTQKPCEKW